MLEEELTESIETEEPRKSRRWIFVLAGILLLLVLGLVAVWATGILDGLGEDSEESNETPRRVNEVIAFEPVVVNLVSPGRMNYARIGISLGVHNPSPGRPVINEDLVVPKVKDRLLELVSGMDSRRLLEAEAKNELKSEILSFVNGMMGEGRARVLEVYFTDFIIQ